MNDSIAFPNINETKLPMTKLASSIDKLLDRRGFSVYEKGLGNDEGESLMFSVKYELGNTRVSYLRDIDPPRLYVEGRQQFFNSGSLIGVDVTFYDGVPHAETAAWITAFKNSNVGGESVSISLEKSVYFEIRRRGDFDEFELLSCPEELLGDISAILGMRTNRLGGYGPEDGVPKLTNQRIIDVLTRFLDYQMPQKFKLRT